MKTFLSVIFIGVSHDGETPSLGLCPSSYKTQGKVEAVQATASYFLCKLSVFVKRLVFPASSCLGSQMSECLPGGILLYLSVEEHAGKT